MSYAARRVALVAAIVLTGLAVGRAAPAEGASFTVSATHDAFDAAPGDGVCADADGACTLRAAVEETNALPGPDEISVPAGEYTGEISITDSLTIDGQGAGVTTIRGPAPDLGSVLTVVTVACGQPTVSLLSVVISGVSITGGQLQGGGINNCGHSVQLKAVTVQANGSAGLNGGGVWNGGALGIIDSTIAGNWAQEGGAIFNDRTGTVRISNSTLSGNQSVAGTGAIRNLSANPVVMENVTVLETALRSDVNAGIFGAAQVRNTIIANAGMGSNCGGAVTSLGHNLSSDGSCNFAGPGDLNNVEPQLTGLQDNGGLTLTHGLYPGSPAIDAGDPSVCPATDQRGVLRPQGAGCDIGAYEYVPPVSPPPTEPPMETESPPPVDTVTSGPIPRLALRATPSPSPAASASASARRPGGTPVFTAPAAVLVDAPSVEEDSGSGVSMLASGLGAAGVLGLVGSAAGGGWYWYRLRRGRK